VRIGYFPGCSLVGSSRDFGESVRAVAKALAIDLVEVPDWACCGASSAHALDPVLSVALPARILAQAAAAGLDEVLAPCAACYNRLVSTQRELETHPAVREAVDAVLAAADGPGKRAGSTAFGAGSVASAPGPPGPPSALAARVRVLNILELLDRLKDQVAAAVKKPFARTVACYYGCLLVRPPRVVAFDRPEDPTSMDALVAAVGGKTVRWSFKTECCGAGLSLPRTSTVAKLAGRIVKDATDRKAEAIVVACPMCHSNLDLRRGPIDAALGGRHEIPVLFVTQVVGLALGLPEKELGLHRHFVPVRLAEPAGVA
jgi:heterodisulfide reductase subunit B